MSLHQGQSVNNEKIAEMARRIVERFAPEKVILFGSHACGTAGPDSDAYIPVISS